MTRSSRSRAQLASPPREKRSEGMGGHQAQSIRSLISGDLRESSALLNNLAAAAAAKNLEMRGSPPSPQLSLPMERERG